MWALSFTSSTKKKLVLTVSTSSISDQLRWTINSYPSPEGKNSCRLSTSSNRLDRSKTLILKTEWPLNFQTPISILLYTNLDKKCHLTVKIIQKCFPTVRLVHNCLRCLQGLQGSFFASMWQSEEYTQVYWKCKTTDFCIVSWVTRNCLVMNSTRARPTRHTEYSTWVSGRVKNSCHWLFPYLTVPYSREGTSLGTLPCKCFSPWNTAATSSICSSKHNSKDCSTNSSPLILEWSIRGSTSSREKD